MRSKKGLFFILIGTGCVLTLPIIFYGAPFQSDDGVTHARWYIHFSEQFWNGNFYPRWLVGMNNGLGSPVFFYYPPVPYFLTSLLKPLFSGDVFGWHQLGVSAVLSLILSGFFAYLWIKQIADRTSALIAAILYMAGPYHLASDLYIRFSFAEFWAFVWLPLILYFTLKMLDGKQLAVAGFAVSYALLVMTHLPTTMIFSLIPIGYAAILKKDGRLKTIAIITASMALGIGLSAIYLYPAIAMQKYVFLDRMSIGYFSYENWLLFSNFSLWPDDKLNILLLMSDLFGIACCSFIISRNNPDKTFKKPGMFWFCIAIGGILMTTALSKPIWLVFYPLQKIQFPFRFGVIVTLAVTFLTAMAISSLKAISFAKNFAAKVIAVLLIAAWIPTTIWAATMAFPLPGTDQKTIDQKVEQGRDAPEYRPRSSESMKEIDWETSKDIDNWDVQMDKEYDGLLKRVGSTDDGLSRVKIVAGTGEVKEIGWESRNILLHANVETDTTVHVSQFYYPGWTARIEADGRELSAQPSPRDGLLSLTIPKGDNNIRLTLDRGAEEIAGMVISSISMFFLLGYIAVIGFARFHGQKKSEA